ncbi:GAF domain-containing sensor histidine kinase [Alkalihalobacillus sp. TS-13]|uniref:GAF domain-containing sensor histidine kinase n=1 Tax=Alkalihalobacillus sp. TS-13 TaxID=2842455 RepID=UPI001C883C32|nr:GAF domain-containing sensor histidine kinase [Alkalihalobacillus sp. TS-13]
MDKATYKNRERNSKIAITIITIIGWLLVIYSLFLLHTINDILSFALLVGFLFITELYPIPVWKSITSLSFPLIYTIVLIHGTWMGLVTLVVVSFTVNLIKRRRIELVWFNPAQLALTLVLTHFVTDATLFLTGTGEENPGYHYYQLLIFTLGFYIINNLLIDMILLLRPQTYPFKDWKNKMIRETVIVIISIIYLGLMLVLAEQNRGGVVDVFSFLFFFSPLVAASIISAFIYRLNREKNRFKALVSLTKELNRTLPSEDWVNSVEKWIDEFIQTDATLFIVKENDDWKGSVKKGSISEGIEKVFEQEWFKRLDESVYFSSRKDLPKGLTNYLSSSIRSVVITPLRVENETVGVLLVGKENNKLYQTTDIQFLSTLANQLAVIIKTRNLFAEREQRIVLEERNRIAREIHDGIAQSLAGAVMKLETSKRLKAGEKEKMQLVNESINKLRGSLHEVRESIYALRPTPSEKFGMVEAVRAKAEEVMNDFNLSVSIRTRGVTKEVSSHIEKNVYEVVAEALQNAGKHSDASAVDVLIRYCREHVIIRISDDGKGFLLYEALLKAKTQAHYGILNMNDLTDQIDASLKINSTPGKGTEILMLVPVSN